MDVFKCVVCRGLLSHWVVQITIAHLCFLSICILAYNMMSRLALYMFLWNNGMSVPCIWEPNSFLSSLGWELEAPQNTCWACAYIYLGFHFFTHVYKSYFACLEYIHMLAKTVVNDFMTFINLWHMGGSTLFLSESHSLWSVSFYIS